MSLALIKSEIERFLADTEPAVLCISGAWGVGKTFAWNRYLQDAQRRQAIGLDHYAYVSLFGNNGLDELKYAIFENTIATTGIGIEPSLETLRTNALAVTKRITKKSLGMFQQLPIVKGHVGGLGPLWYLAVSRTIICLDDIERRGKNLDLRDVLGLVTQLKEQKHCKVCLILNDEALNESQHEFRTYFEKVVDTQLTFAPSPEEATGIALDPKQANTHWITHCCVILCIANIRLIKKIERAVQQVIPFLNSFHAKVTDQAIQSLVLFAWSLYEPQRAPTPEFLGDRATYIVREKRDQIGPREAAWNALLDTYGFLAMDEFDSALLAGLRNGYFDQAIIRRHATVLDGTLQNAEARDSIEEAWKRYHDSFDDDQEQTLDAIYSAFVATIRHIDVLNFSQTVAFFKELGRPEQAAEMLEAYVAAHKGNPAVFDIENYPFRDRITDPDVIHAFQHQHNAVATQAEAAAILRNMAERRGWHPDDLAVLAIVSVDEYWRIFKGYRGDVLHGIINMCLQFQGQADNQGIIANKARSALERIGRESAMNALRVSKYGIRAGGPGRAEAAPQPEDSESANEDEAP
jgi:hypothetical protein